MNSRQHTIWQTLILLGLFCICGCRPAADSRVLKIGLAQEPRTLNIWLASDANSKKILSLIYQPLYHREPRQMKIVPWLAKGLPVFDPQTTSYTVTLRSAKWSDGSPLTAADVAFTIRLIREFKVPAYYSRWEFVTRVVTPDPHTIRFYLKKPMAIFKTRSLTIPIVSCKEWALVAEEARKTEKPLAYLLNHPIDRPLGCGPFLLRQWQRGAFVHLTRNPYFFGAGLLLNGFRLGPFVDGILYKIFGTSDVAVLALKKGTIDLFWKNIQPGYIEDLATDPNIRIHANEKSALYFMGFNLRRSPFDDLALRRAVAALVDRDFIISRILQGYGSRMFSIVPAENDFWCSKHVDRHCAGLSREKRIRVAWEILKKAGYTWEVPPVQPDGRLVKAGGIRMPDGRLMKNFTILTPPADYDPHRAMTGLIIQEWLRDLGLPAYARPMSFSSLIQQVKAKQDFQAFILGYGKLSPDPDYVRVFFHSRNDKPRGWNMSGYHNPVFDQMADNSTAELDPVKRQQLLFRMQQVIAKDLPYIPIYKPKLMEAVRTDRFSGWIDMQNGIGNIWSFCLIRPAPKKEAR